MTVNDLVESASPISAYVTLTKTAWILSGAALVLCLAAGIFARKNRKRTVTLTAAGSAITLAAVLTTGLFVISDLRQREEAAIAANAQTLKTWAEPAYGIDISDKSAEFVMSIRGTAWEKHGLIFEADTADGPVYAELHENADGSFRITHDNSELERTNTDDHQ